MKKRTYQTPCVKKTVAVLLEKDFLAGSVVKKDTKVQTKGQEVASYDFSQSSFNHDWE